MSRRTLLARVRLPLTIDEHLDIIAMLERHHGGTILWRHAPMPQPKWLVLEREAS